LRCEYKLLIEAFVMSTTELLPDLKVTAITASPTGTILDKITVSWTVTNVGNAIAQGSSWVDGFFISIDKQLDLSFRTRGDLEIGDVGVDAKPNSLAPGESYTLTKEFTIGSYFFRSPGNSSGTGAEYTPTGDVYLLAYTDYYPKKFPTPGVIESNEGNNLVEVPINIKTPDVDLVVTSITAPASFTPGQPFTVSWVVTNQGSVTAAANSWTDYIYLESKPGLPPVPFFNQYVREASSSEPPLKPGASYTLSTTFITPSAEINPGDYFLVVETDAHSPSVNPFGNKYQPETNENNNKLKVPISTSAPGTDLVVSSITAPTRVAINTPFNLSWVVTNQGAISADSQWIDTIYLSNDPILDATDTYLGYYSTAGNPPLAAGASYTATQTLTLPSEFEPSRYDYLLVVTDGDKNYQAETSEDNNIATYVIDIVKQPTAGLNLIGTNGRDTLKGGSGNDTLSGLRDNDYLIGGNSQDSLLGGQGEDVLLGGRGSDILVGGKGKDTLTGGVGQDEFVYTQFSDRGDLITDFKVGQDKIVLTQLLTSLGIDSSSVDFRDTAQGTSLILDPDGLGPSGFKPFILVQGSGVTALSLSNSNSLVF
jgi:hypothetical protein